MGSGLEIFVPCGTAAPYAVDPEVIDMRQAHVVWAATKGERDSEGHGSRVPAHQPSREKTMADSVALDAGGQLNSTYGVVWKDDSVSPQVEHRSRVRCACSSNAER